MLGGTAERKKRFDFFDSMRHTRALKTARV
jgi:hypothetical protein